MAGIYVPKVHEVCSCPAAGLTGDLLAMIGADTHDALKASSTMQLCQGHEQAFMCAAGPGSWGRVRSG